MTKRILTIDGGGIKGVFPASFLASIEEQIEGDIFEYFDLIVGTSTGGIIAIGLGLGMTSKEILKFYEEQGPKIFAGNKALKKIRHLFNSKYESEQLKKALEEVFSSKKLGNSKTRLVIPSFNLNTGEVYVYKTAHNERFKRDYKEDVITVALSTSAAPTFFPVHYTSSHIPLVDGGLWANNPMGLAAVEALGVLGWIKGEVKMLSIGCTMEAFTGKIEGGKLAVAPQIADIFMASQSSASLGTAQLLLGHENVTRINPYVPKGSFSLDGIGGISTLKSLGITEARKELPNIEHFFKEKAESFVPNHTL